MAADLAYNGNNKTIESLLDSAVHRIVRLKHPRKIIESYNGDLNDYITLICNCFAWIDSQLVKEELSVNEFQTFHSIVETLIYENGVYKRLDYNDETQTLELINELGLTAEKVMLYGGVLQIVKDGIDVMAEIKHLKSLDVTEINNKLKSCKFIEGDLSTTHGYKYLLKHLDELTTFECGIQHCENHDLAGCFGAESDEQIGRIKNALTIGEQNEDVSSENERILICLVNIISDYMNIFIKREYKKNNDIETETYTENQQLIQYLFMLKKRNIKELYKYTSDLTNANDPRRSKSNDLIALNMCYINNSLTQLDRLINCRHIMFKLNELFKIYEKKNITNEHKTRAYILNSFADSANELNLTNDKDNLKQLIVLCKNNNKRGNIEDLLRKIYRKAHQFNIVTKYTSTIATSQPNSTDFKNAIHLLKIGVCGLILLIEDGKFTSNQPESISVEIDGKIMNIRFETTFASPFFAAIEHEMKMISFILDRDFYEAYCNTDFREFVNDLECELNDDFYINNQDVESSYYNNLTVRETFRIANHIVFITLNAINMGQYYIQNTANFQKLCASTLRLSSILTHYLCGGKLLTEGVIGNNWDGDKINITSQGGSTWLHNELKQILLNILSLNNYNITLKKAIIFTIVYINHWIRGDFHLESSKNELQITKHDIDLLYENDTLYGFLGVEIPSSEVSRLSQLDTYIEFCKFSSGVYTQSGLSYNDGIDELEFPVRFGGSSCHKIENESKKIAKYSRRYDKLTTNPFKYLNHE